MIIFRKFFAVMADHRKGVAGEVYANLQSGNSYGLWTAKGLRARSAIESW